MMTNQVVVGLLLSLAAGGLLAGGVWLFTFARPAARMRRSLARAGGAPAKSTGGGLLALFKVPALGRALIPENAERRSRLQRRLAESGYYAPHALSLFLGVRVLLIATGALVGFSVGLFELLSPKWAIITAFALTSLGVIAPGWWLDGQKKKRQSALRRALPDALDMLVLALEGGLSLTGALQQMTDEIQSVHPLLGEELNVVQGEMQLGVSAGEALQHFGRRTDLEDVRSLAGLLLQAERFGAGVVEALRIHSNALREQRQQQAEEMAQKAAVKILFPTLLCIFPAIFIVILGPAALQIIKMLHSMR